MKLATSGDRIFPNGSNDFGNAGNTFNDWWFHTVHASAGYAFPDSGTPTTNDFTMALTDGVRGKH